MGEFERQVTDLLCCEEAHTKRIGRENEKKKQRKRDRSLLPVELLHFPCGSEERPLRSV